MVNFTPYGRRNVWQARTSATRPKWTPLRAPRRTSQRSRCRPERKRGREPFHTRDTKSIKSLSTLCIGPEKGICPVPLFFSMEFTLSRFLPFSALGLPAERAERDSAFDPVEGGRSEEQERLNRPHWPGPVAFGLATSPTGWYISPATAGGMYPVPLSGPWQARTISTSPSPS